MLALQEILNHNYPIVIDSFRAEDLSTTKERIVLDLYKKISNQIIFTTTLKIPELGKYDKEKGINHIDYMDHVPSKMLSKDYVKSFIQLLTNLSMQI